MKPGYEIHDETTTCATNGNLIYVLNWNLTNHYQASRRDHTWPESIGKGVMQSCIAIFKIKQK